MKFNKGKCGLAPDRNNPMHTGGKGREGQEAGHEPAMWPHSQAGQQQPEQH